MLTGILGFALVATVLCVFTRPGRRLLRAIGINLSAQADRAAEAVSNADPVGVLKTEIANAAENGKQANAVVESAAQQMVSLEDQIADGEKEIARLNSRLAAVVKNGDPNNTAAQYAENLAKEEANLKANNEQLLIAKKLYDDNLKLVASFEEKIAMARKDAEDLGQQLAQSEAEKNLTQVTVALRNKLATGSFAEARKRIQDKINANRGSTRAANDLNASAKAEELDAKLERSAAAEEILARFQKPSVSQTTAPVSVQD